MTEALHPVLAYLVYIVTSLLVLGVFMAVYVRITPHPEFTLIRAGNLAAALSLGGAVLGFSLTLSSSIQHTPSWGSFLLWSLGAFVVQVVAYLLASRAIRDMSAQIVANNVGMGALMGAISLAVGVVNAACIS